MNALIKPKLECNTCDDCGITDETVKLDGDYYKCEDCIHFFCGYWYGGEEDEWD